MKKNQIKGLKIQDEIRALEKLEAGIKVKIGDKDINEVYNDKLNQTIDLNETVSKALAKQPKPGRQKKEKPVKELTEKGKRASATLSKYRQQVKEALELKKSLENKQTLVYSEDEDEEEEEQQVVSRKPEPAPKPVQQQPVLDLTPLYNEITAIKQKNKELEDRFAYRSTLMDVSNMRRNMSVKF
jgi:hypothetical protein